MSDLRVAVEGLPHKVYRGIHRNYFHVDRDAVLALIPKGAVLVTLPRDDSWRLVKVGTEFLSQFGTRTERGEKLTASWGERGEDGTYTPTLTATDDGAVLVTEETLAAALHAAWPHGRAISADHCSCEHRAAAILRHLREGT